MGGLAFFEEKGRGVDGREDVLEGRREKELRSGCTDNKQRKIKSINKANNYKTEKFYKIVNGQSNHCLKTFWIEDNQSEKTTYHMSALL